MQIAGTSNDDPMPWAQIDEVSIFLSSSIILFFRRASLLFPVFSRTLLLLLMFRLFFRAGASIRMQSKSYHFTERIFFYSFSSAKSALLA